MIFNTKFKPDDKVWVIVQVDCDYVHCSECGHHKGYQQKHKVYRGVIDSVEVSAGWYRFSRNNTKRNGLRPTEPRYKIWCKNCTFSEESESSNDSRHQGMKERDIYKNKKDALKECKRRNNDNDIRSDDA